jgi:hypothetical protein
MTVGDLVKRGVEDVKAFCGDCGKLWRAPITFLPPATGLRKVAALMLCPRCGGREIEVSTSGNESSGRLQ